MSALVATGVRFSVQSPLPAPVGSALPGAAVRMRCLPTGAAVPLLHLAFSPEGRMLAAGSDAGRVRLWSLPVRVNLHPTTSKLVLCVPVVMWKPHPVLRRTT